jgi:hypothetical protein
MPQSPTSPARIEAAERQALALKMRKEGCTYDKIAQRVGYASPAGAEKAVKAALHKMIKDDAQDVLTFEIARLDEMLEGAYGLACVGNPIAITSVLKIMERRAKLLGIDAPTKVTLEYNLSAEKINRIARQLVESGIPEQSLGDAFEEFMNAYLATAPAHTDGSETS